ncbi:MAG: DUF1232 domain-containing protein [Bacteroidaceae bacterium]|nr:DUF1232 domain-containing protein [Bacteroidaceae bacterium]
MNHTTPPKQPSINELDGYKKNYSDSAFWRKVKALGKLVLKPAVLLYCVMKSAEVPFHIKTTIAGALGYLILPTDLIPDFVPITGYTDDVAALLAVIKICSKYITPKIKTKAEETLNQMLKVTTNNK